MTNYYDGTKLLSLTDLDGNRPEIYISTTNRSAGKTTFFGRWFIRKYLENKEKFGLIYRYNYELSDVPDKFFKELSLLFFPEWEMISKVKSKGIYTELFLKRKNSQELLSCGYAISINNADQIKKLSHLFSDITRLLFDEFQSESKNYCANEIQKFQSIHTSIARGGGKQCRYLPVYMLSNFVTILNPYYTALSICDRLSEKTNYLRGHGWVLEQIFYSEVGNLQSESAFNRAFTGSDYAKFNTEKMYLSDSKSFVEPIKGNNRYICTIVYEGTEYAIREYPEQGIIYCDTHVDSSFTDRIAVTTSDHQINYVMLNHNDLLISVLRKYFEQGCFRFRSQACKNAVLQFIGYH